MLGTLLRLKEEEYTLLDINQLVAQLIDRCNEIAKTSIHNLVGIHQDSKEDVLTFCDCMLVAAKPLLQKPHQPRKMVVMNGGRRFIPSLNHEMEFAVYQQKCNQHEMYDI